MRSDPIDCKKCGGEGIVPCATCRGEGAVAGPFGAKLCPACNGEEPRRQLCVECNGERRCANPYADTIPAPRQEFVIKILAAEHLSGELGAGHSIEEARIFALEALTRLRENHPHAIVVLGCHVFAAGPDGKLGKVFDPLEPVRLFAEAS